MTGRLDSLRKNVNQVIIEGAEIIQLTKEKNGLLGREILTRIWHDWNVDFDYDSKYGRSSTSSW